MNKELLDALTRLKDHLEKDFDTDNYVKGGQAEKDIAEIKSVLEQDQELPAPPKDCQFNKYKSVCDTCEKCEKHETCARFKALKENYIKSMNECYAMPYLEGRYNGD